MDFEDLISDDDDLGDLSDLLRSLRPELLSDDMFCGDPCDGDDSDPEDLEDFIELIRSIPADFRTHGLHSPADIEKGLKEGRILIDAEQLDRATGVISFFERLRLDIFERDIEVRQCPYSGDIQVTFEVLDICGDFLDEFRRLLRYADSLGIRASCDGRLLLEITVPDIFVSAEDFADM